MKSRGWLIVASAVVAACGVVWMLQPWWTSKRAGEANGGAVAGAKSGAGAQYIGGLACKECHAKEYEAWMGSDHQLAMQEATAKTVLGDFRDAKFSYAGVTSKFYTRDEKFFVQTDGPDGKLGEYEIKYTFGVHPLQQYLVPFPDGRMQALSIAWDTRPKEQGGQRWFHLYPKERIVAGDELHWTRLQQNWNFMCAECHSTDLKKNYDAGSNTYKSTWSEINVSCEACHGAGSAHADWAKAHPGVTKREGNADDGLQGHFDDRRDVYWKMNYITGNSERSRARGDTEELEMCGRCHARRSEISEAFVAGKPLLNTHRVALLDEGLYTADGQMKDEVYNYGSFVQSKMFAKGVTCSDCHEPHTQKLRQEKEKVCGECHNLRKYEAAEHHHHKVGTKGASCIGCHMPVRTYMVVDPRHDHSFRIPRPDESVKYGTPNACTDCHAGKTAAWAAKAMNDWYGPNVEGFQKYTEALAAAQGHAAGAEKLLLRAINEEKTPGIAKATALKELQTFPDPEVYQAGREGLQSADAMERLGAVEMFAASDAGTRWRTLAPMFSDPVRAIRIAAADEAADAVPTNATAEERASFERALAEYIEAQKFNADRPEGRMSLGNLYGRQGKGAEAEAEYRAALKLEPSFIPAYVNLADLMRASGREEDAGKLLEEARGKAPKNAEVVHALGLLRVRQHKEAEALELLKRSCELARDNPRYPYVYGIALYSSGKKKEAMEALREANRRFPADRDTLLGLATISAESGDIEAAKKYADQLMTVAPSDPRGGQLLRQLEGGGR